MRAAPTSPTWSSGPISGKRRRSIHDEVRVPATLDPRIRKAVKTNGAGEQVLIYRVKKGDTIWDIARAHNVEPRDLKSWNDISRNRIFAGQELKIHLTPADSRQ